MNILKIYNQKIKIKIENIEFKDNKIEIIFIQIFFLYSFALY